jgi:putative effector of murein hydrolase LrgA (UPF0299 family)
VRKSRKLTNSDRLAIVLACLAGVMAIVLFLTEKTPASVVGLVLLMYFLSVYPVCHFVDQTWRRLVTLSIVAVVAFLQPPHRL